MEFDLAAGQKIASLWDGSYSASGQHVTVAAEGPDAEEAVATIVAILAEATRVGA